MMHRRIIFIIADGQRARIVERSAETGHFVTVEELDGSGRLKEARAWAKSHPPGRSFESASSARHAVGPEDPYRQVKSEFATEVADAASRRAEETGVEEVVLVAPTRILADLKAHVAPNIRVLNSLAKDLTKTPDAELPRWLDPLELVSEPR